MTTSVATLSKRIGTEQSLDWADNDQNKADLVRKMTECKEESEKSAFACLLLTSTARALRKEHDEEKFSMQLAEFMELEDILTEVEENMKSW